MKKVKEKKLITYGLYCQIIDNFQHYNKIQTRFKFFVLSWLMVTFIGIGYTISFYETELSLSPLISSSLICLASSLGIIVIGYMDIVVKEETIATLVHKGLILEKENQWLPQVIHTCQEVNILTGYISNKKIFYLGGLIILFFSLLFINVMFIFITKIHITTLIVSLSILFSLLCLIILCIVKKIDPYQKLIRKTQNV